MFVLFPVVLILDGCANGDIKTANKFGEVSNTFGQLNTTVADDIYNSCSRSSTWIARDTTVARQNIRDVIKTYDAVFRSNSVLDSSRLTQGINYIFLFNILIICFSCAYPLWSNSKIGANDFKTARSSQLAKSGYFIHLRSPPNSVSLPA